MAPNSPISSPASTLLNRHEGFRELVQITTPELRGVPFRYTYTVGYYRTPQYIAQWDGGNTSSSWLNCQPCYSDGTTIPAAEVEQAASQIASILVIFRAHSLPKGRVHVKREFALTDADFHRGVFVKTLEDDIDIELTDAPTPATCLPVQVDSTILLNMLRGYDGKQGNTGKSAYQSYKEANPTYTGTEEEWGKQMAQRVVIAREHQEAQYTIATATDESVHFTPQVLTAAQQQQARDNINAPSKDGLVTSEDAEIDILLADPSLLTGAVRYDVAQVKASSEIQQAQENLHVADEDRTIYLEEKMAELDASGVTVIGDPSQLKTVHKDYLVNAINDNYDSITFNTNHIGNLALLNVFKEDGVTRPTDLVTALNLVKDSTSMQLVEETTPNADMVKTYTIYNGVNADGDPIEVGQIDIPLDKVLIDGEVILSDGTDIIGTDTAGDSILATAGNRYIKLTFENDTRVTYIDIDSLEYTAEQPTTDPDTGEEIPLQVQLTIDKETHVISAVINEDQVTKTELDDQSVAELEFTGYNHDYDDDTHADYGTAQLTTTAQNLREAVNELDALQGDKANLPYLDETDPADVKYATITENLKKLFSDAVHTHIVDTLPIIDDTIGGEDIYILHSSEEDVDELGNPVMLDLDRDGVKETRSVSHYYTPYRLSEDRDNFVCIFHQHEFETSPISFTTDVKI